MTGGPMSRDNPQNWDPASGIQVPDLPTVTPGEDTMSQTIAGILPTMGAPLQANVAALQGKEALYSGKVAASNVAYQGSEDSGSQGVMQIMQTLMQMGGQAGQLGQVAGAPMQMGSQFGQLMQPMMQAFQGLGHGGGEHGLGGQGGAGAAGGGGQGSAGLPSAQQQEREEGKPQAQAGPQHERERDDHAAAGAQAGPGDVRQGLSPVPTLPPLHSQPDADEDLGNRL